MNAPKRNDAVTWLRANGGQHDADAIERIVRAWRDDFVRTRRNWWAALGGKRDGTPCTIAGHTFGVYAAVRERQGLPPTPKAIRREDEGPVPAIDRTHGRWSKRGEGLAANENAAEAAE